MWLSQGAAGYPSSGLGEQVLLGMGDGTGRRWWEGAGEAEGELSPELSWCSLPWQAVEHRIREEQRAMDRKIVLELDRKVADQQSTLEKAGVAGFYVTTNPQVSSLARPARSPAVPSPLIPLGEIPAPGLD